MFTQSEWQFINTFAPWLSAFGTILAVVTSLYLASRKSKIKLEAHVGLRLIIGRGDSAPFPQFLSFQITNVGGRPARISNIGWEVGFFKKDMPCKMLQD